MEEILSKINFLLYAYQHLITALGFLLTFLGLVIAIITLRKTVKDINSKYNDVVNKFRKELVNRRNIGEMSSILELVNMITSLVLNKDHKAVYYKLIDLRSKLILLRLRMKSIDESIHAELNPFTALCKEWEDKFAHLMSTQNIHYKSKDLILFLSDLKELILKIQEKNSLLHGDNHDTK